MQIVLWWYLTIFGLGFMLGIVLGKILKRDALGNGMKLGIGNSLLLSAIWPVTLAVLLGGVVYDGIQIWKKL